MLDRSDIDAAQDTIARYVHHTPTFSARRLGRAIGTRLFHKAELFQKTGSFKPRGALNRVHNTPSSGLQRGLITVSAGNHAQGLAYAAREVGARCMVVMPENAPRVKVDATRSYGAEVVLHGDVNQAYEKMEELRAEHGLTLVHPFDDPLVISGQGTIGLEILDDVQDVTLIVVPVGGGGLISGIGLAAKTRRPSVRIVGVEPAGAAPMRASWDAGHPVRLSSVDTFADGLAAPLVSDLTYQLSRSYVDEVVTVTEDELVQGLEALMTSAKLYAEGGGAAPTAALLAGKVELDGDDVVVAVVSGGNLDWQMLGELING
ncbi:MAG: pyridoxal-phosphate dependent enzyme [Actinomycetota bacterium]|nr:pyridoxal-phosphate dependent enzyme [Actinomycetota bacterium]